MGHFETTAIIVEHVLPAPKTDLFIEARVTEKRRVAFSSARLHRATVCSPALLESMGMNEREVVSKPETLLLFSLSLCVFE